MNSKKIIFIVGPTAVGKSDVAYNIAKKIQGEIISCDSMQVYKEIDIANNKPPQDILKEIPHYLVSMLSIQKEFDVSQFNDLALQSISDIHARGKVPVIVGGSGMYMQVLLDGIFKGGVKNEALRKDLKEQAKQYGNQYLYDRLKEMDPAAAGKIHPNDVRRVIRALEVCISEEAPISQLQKDREGLWGCYEISLFALNRERKELYDRINQRVEEMFRQGVIDEISALDGMVWSKTASKIIGVQEVQSVLRSECSLEEAKEAMKMNTRHLAKRQLTWFQKDKRLEWITMIPDDKPKTLSEEIVKKWHQGSKTGSL
jgi:tRNA dimethylallyltransferase